MRGPTRPDTEWHLGGIPPDKRAAALVTQFAECMATGRTVAIWIGDLVEVMLDGAGKWM